jgi:hypothetical protein
MKALASILGLLVIFSLFSCASDPYRKLDEAVQAEDFERALSEMESNRRKIYPNKDEVLYHLDKGMISHYAGVYKDSTQTLQDGERAIEAAYTKSITLEAGTYLLNDNVQEYSGEDYEDIYINAFNALNYYHLGSLEDALVEVRHMTNKLQFLASKYAVVTSELQQKALADGTEIPYEAQTQHFTDSALARYLGILFFRGTGRYDDARIDRDYLKLAFANAPSVYTHPVPSSIDSELEMPAGQARLNVIGFGGLSPVKEEVATRIFLPTFNWIKIALPEMKSRPSNIGRVEVVVHGGQSFNLELLESIEAVAQETFKEKQGVIYLKSIIRATVKGTTAAVLNVAANETDDSTAGLVLGVLGLATQIFAEASEQADLRISRYFPARAYIGGINLPPGVYSLTVNYYGTNGRRIASYPFEKVPVRENTVNLVESVCFF